MMMMMMMSRTAAVRKFQAAEPESPQTAKLRGPNRDS